MSISIWDTDLETGEILLWQGQPAGKFIWPRELKILVVIITIAGLVALYWMVVAFSAGRSYWTQHLGLLLLAILAAAAAIWTARREHFYTTYALSNQRAFIAIIYPVFGRKTSSYPITCATPVKFDTAEQTTIVFASRRSRTQNGWSRNFDIGFRRIQDGARVYALIQDVQRGKYRREL